MSSCNNLLEQLIHAREQHRWNCEAEHPRSFEIDEKLELGRLFDRNVGGFGAFQDLCQRSRRLGGTPPTRTGGVRKTKATAAVTEVPAVIRQVKSMVGNQSQRQCWNAGPLG